MAFGGIVADEATDGTQQFAHGAIHIVVPAPSIEQLQRINAACSAPITVEQSLAASVEADYLSDFIAQVEALPEGSIPPGCAADLLTMAQALQSQ